MCKNIHNTFISIHNYGKHTFQYAATNIWELVPIGIKSLPFYSFKKSYNKYLLLNQNQS